MKVFVTVGTTVFDELIKNIDKVITRLDGVSFIFQIAKGKYKPKNADYFDFTSDIDFFYNEADLIITHAGAGSIYRLLELNKKIIVVPNMVRVDKHQKDISTYMSEKNHVLLLSDFNNTLNVIQESYEFIPEPFIKHHFFVKDQIIKFIKDCI
ncbi:PssE/Cps14G family polysaccharide biosynthesis glycosyltransferase [Photobacterium leiognathi]|uniref:PssE/Cps14G family polysaccharide biosynthesis glycosyltransferase n=1 Tax=Photobacterium leiognathi TaxID=553611 RepID=UPI00020884D6|nr:PssE/Cps14G family polysaccharide biosynthesis glycosyltransferase [Photobacterium leiognathi]PSW53767.1 glycosyltransferase [Photobacterium leiognathi subsp. mandapamensis]GAA04676.1 glycosyltransferase family 28 C-terminal domain protein [Photobacterium leiognathi subsp. mandapamensis svers.1.1.]